MASKYLQKYPVPQHFQQILADFTREVLRDQPTNIIEYAAKYFELKEKGEKFEYSSKFNVGKDDKKYELSYKPQNADDITKKAANIANKVQKQPPQTYSSAEQPEQTYESNESHQAPSIKNVPSEKQVQHEPVSTQTRPESPMNAQIIGTEKTVNQQEVENYISHQDEQLLIEEQFREQVNTIFDQIDLDHNNYITSSEITRAIELFIDESQSSHRVDPQIIQEFITAVDDNQDGKISREELFNFVYGQFVQSMQQVGEQLFGQ